MNLVAKEKYRKDIDGLRAFAVISVIIFHLGFLPNGFLGVDVFFLISGYLITDILFRELNDDKYSVKNFYLRRIRRILPLVSFICLIALLLGVVFMLPDDLENLSQSVVATNFFGNNMLQTLTTKNYWDVVNEYKPLMHTWSLAVEEQYYFIYPIIFSLFKKKRKTWILPIIIVLTIVSLFLYFSPIEDYWKFYTLPFRFFEMSLGGIAAVLLNGRVVKTRFASIFVLILILLMVFKIDSFPPQIWLILTVLITCIVLSIDNASDPIIGPVLTNPFVRFIGNISFSLYMWHQLVFAFGRYMVFEEIAFKESFILISFTVILSVLTYYFIEQPFRKKNKIGTKAVLSFVVLSFVLTTGISGYLIMKAGVIRDVPELGISKDNIELNMHGEYNSRIHGWDRPFSSPEKQKVLVIGDSFARDWVNALNESEYSKQLDISYIYNYENHDSLSSRFEQAEFVFFVQSIYSEEKYEIINKFLPKAYLIGTKNFGSNNGLYYNYSGDEYCSQMAKVDPKYYNNNEEIKKQYPSNFIEIMDLFCDKESKTVKVFTPDCKFISQDCRHLTKDGAKYLGSLIPTIKNFPITKRNNY